jgi:hypothetical protein
MVRSRSAAAVDDSSMSWPITRWLASANADMASRALAPISPMGRGAKVGVLAGSSGWDLVDITYLLRCCSAAGMMFYVASKTNMRVVFGGTDATHYSAPVQLQLLTT